MKLILTVLVELSGAKDENILKDNVNKLEASCKKGHTSTWTGAIKPATNLLKGGHDDLYISPLDRIYGKITLIVY
jgi:hypothetical protein